MTTQKQRLVFFLYMYTKCIYIIILSQIWLGKTCNKTANNGNDELVLLHINLDLFYIPNFPSQSKNFSFNLFWGNNSKPVNILQ